MRRVPSEMKVHGEGRPLPRRRAVASLKARRRHATIEGLERRELMAVVPMVIADSQQFITGAAVNSGVWQSAPSIAVNPNNPNQLVAVYSNFDPAGATNQQRRSSVRVSSDGGATWAANGVTVPGVRIDPTTGSNPLPYSEAYESYVAWDRNNNFYISTLQTNTAGNAGHLRINHFNWNGAAPTLVATRDAYQWDQTVTTPVDQSRQAGIDNYYLAVDSNLSSFTDPETGITQTDPNSGAIYIAATWNTPPPNPAPGDYSRWSIRLLSSTNSGASFNAGINVDSSPNSTGSGLPLVTRPRIAISQGNTFGTVEGGRVTVIWDDYNSGRIQSPPTDVIRSRSVRLTFGTNTLATVGGAGVVGSTRVLGALGRTYGRTTLQSPLGVGPGAEIASDNTLGSFSPNQGRLYVAFTDWNDTPSNPAENTDIKLRASDNGGTSWFAVNGKVNDDNGIVDGKTGGATGGDVQNGLASNEMGRTQFQPQVAVDQYTGAVVVSFLDARDDAANARVATYVGVSIDGGSSFSKQTFANASLTPLDAITGDRVTLGPIPDNQSAGAGNKVEATFAFGDHQGLAVANGRILPVWTGNQNGGHLGDNDLRILSAQVSYARGPRVISNTSGQVEASSFTNPFTFVTTTWNDTFAADGRPLLDGFLVTFDRAVETADLQPWQFQTWYQDVLTSDPTFGVPIQVTSVEALDDDDANGDATTYLVRLDPATIAAIYASPSGGVGTYSYSVGSGISDRIRYRSTGIISDGNTMDQDGARAAAISIPERPFFGNPIPMTSTIEVPQYGLPFTLANLSVSLTIEHGRTSDLLVELIGPDNTTITLADAIGGTAGGFLSTTFDSNAATAITAGVSPFTGWFTPQNSLTPGQGLDAFLGKSLEGTWTLRVTDTVRGIPQRFGVLRGWSITATPVEMLTPQQTFSSVVADQFSAPSTENNTPFSSPYVTSTLPLIVPGAHVVSSRVPGAQPSVDNLVTDAKASQIQVTFDRDIIVSSFTPDKVLSLVGPAGPVLVPQTSLATGVNINKVIPDNPLLPLTSTISIPNNNSSFPIRKLTVKVNVSHTQTSDLLFELVGPDGLSTVVLADAVGGNGQNFTDTVFDNDSRVPITTGTAPFTGTFAPQNAATVGEGLDKFNGIQLQGVWTLRITDKNGNNRAGILNSWSLTATPAATVTAENPVGGLARTFTIGFPEQMLRGTYTFSIDSSVRSSTGLNGPNPGDVGAFLDTNQNAGVDLLFNRQTPGTAGLIQNYNAATTPVTIPAAVGSTPSIAWAPLLIGDSFDIQSVTVNLNITYGNVPDLLGELLVFPAGTDVSSPTTVTPLFTVTLFNRDGNVGPAGTRRNFTNTVFDDAASTLIQNGGPPFNGRFKPRTPLSVLVGENPSQLVYALRVTNNGTSAGTIDRWGFSLEKSVPGTGLGEPIADRPTASFRLFTMDPTNPLSSSEWTPVGPAGFSSGKLAGSMTAIAVDPTDPSGNTVYVGAASGGVWRTSNFLTTASNGPTYLPLTDFGPNSSLNTGSIALFGRNNDPFQTVIIAGTGDPSMQFGSPVGGLDTSRGVGFIRSLDAGASWTLLDSLQNTDAQGNPLPLAQRRHEFVGMTVNKVLIDPKLSINGQMIMYAAVSGQGGTPAGVYRSLDGGLNWQLRLAGPATDILFDDNSGTIDAVDNPTGNYRAIFAAIGGQGIFRSPNQGERWDPMAGGIGNPTIQDDITRTPIPVTGNNVFQAGTRIVLARPALTGLATVDTLYQNWLYAAVSSGGGGAGGGTFAGLYMTKDLGQNWVRVALPNADNSPDLPVPSNNISRPNYDVTSSATFPMGLNNVSISVSPENPNIVYIGGTRLSGNRSDGLNKNSALIRVNVAGVSDAHAFFGANDRNDGGTRQVWSTDAVGFIDKNPAHPQGNSSSLGNADLNPIINLVIDPNNFFASNTTIFVNNTTAFANTGAGAIWTTFDASLRDSGGVHQMVAIRDQLTGLTRLTVVDDQGVFTGVDLNGNYVVGIGTNALPFGSRNGNLQTTQFHYGASQPGSLAAQTANALFYGQSQGNGFPESNPDLLSQGTAGYGDLQWSVAGGVDYIGYGVGIATDQTGSGTVYKYQVPSQINDGQLQINSSLTDFFKVKPNGGTETSRTFNLIQASGGGQVPDPQWPFYNSTGQANVGNFAVNPITPNQMIIGSAAGRLFGTQNQGNLWSVIAQPGNLDGTYVQAPAFGAPDPNGPGVPGALNNYILAGTRGGRVFVTLTGGGNGSGGNAWFDISSGLDGSPVMSIITNPTRGSQEAYAVTQNRVYRITNTSQRNGAGTVVGSGWVDITGDLFSQTRNAFGDANLTQAVLSTGTLTSIVADWRYVIPDVPPTPSNPNPPTHPMLYVAGLGGVLRTENGINSAARWQVFPDLSLNTPQDKGGMPSVQVTDLDMALGNINPTTGRPDVSTGPNVMLASTYGRGAYAIKLAPIVFKSSVRLATGSDSGRPIENVPPGGNPSNHPGDLTDLYTNVLTPVFQGLSQQSAFGGQVAITLYDATDSLNPVVIGGYDPASGPFDPLATYFTDTFGNFAVQVNAGVWTAVTSDGVKVIRVQATDQAGTRGNLADFTFTLDTTAPAKPNAPTLSPNSDSGFSNSDNYTNDVRPGMVVLPTEGNITVYLLRKLASAPSSAYQIVNTLDLPPLLNGASPLPVTISDPGPLVDGDYVFAVQQIDPAGNLGPRSDDSPVITIDTTRPNAPSRPVLTAGSDSGVQGDNITSDRSPILTIGTAESSPTRVFLKRNGTSVPNTGNPANPRLGPGAIQDPGQLADGTYAYVAFQQDLAGNISTDSAAVNVRILTAVPTPIPTVALFPDDDSGVKGDNATRVRQPRLFGVAPIPPAEGYTIQLVQVSPTPSGNPVLATTPVPNTGNYVIQFPNQLPDGQITIVIRVLDVAGNFSSSLPLTLSINTAPPAIVPTLVIRPADDTGVKGDNKTTVRKPFLVGTTSPGAIVELLVAGPNSIDQVVATTTADAVTGNYQAQLPLELSNGTITVRARARDNVGNVNPNVGTLTMTIYTADGDFINAGQGQIAVYRNSDGFWYINNGNGTRTDVQHGWPLNDVPLPADFNGDGRVDVTVFRPQTATWYINRGGNLGQYNVQWGWAGHDTPVPSDYDGDGKADIAVYRPETAQWFVLGSATTMPVISFGWAGVDKPVPGDYQRIGKSQIAVWRPPTGQWFMRDNNTGLTSILQLGQAGDIPQQGDYAGLGYTQQAVYRPSTDQFIIFNPNAPQTPIVVSLGKPNTGTPTAIDYDGDGKVDPAVYRPATAEWAIFQSTTNTIVTTTYGWPLNDIAVNGPLSYRVASVNNRSQGVPASASSFTSQVGSGQVAIPGSTGKTSKSPLVIVGAVTPGSKRAAARQNRVNQLMQYAQSHPKVMQRLSKAVAKHPLASMDQLLEQLGRSIRKG